MRKMSRGERIAIAHQDYNRWQDAGAAKALERLGNMPGLSDNDSSHEGIILVKNTLPRRLKRYSVLGLRGTIPDPLMSEQQSTDFQDRIALKGETPSSVTTGRFCVIQTDAEIGEVVPALVSGVTPCRLNIQSLTDEFADIETDDTVDQTRWLKTGGSGAAQILYHPEYTGEQWGVVRLSNKTGNWKLAIASSLYPGLWTPSSSGDTEDHTFTYLSTSDGSATFELDATPGNIVVNRTVTPCFTFAWLTTVTPFVRNNWCLVQGILQSRNPVGGAWTDTGHGGQLNTAWPDLGTLSSSGGFNYGTINLTNGIGYGEGRKLRIRTTASYSGSAPALTFECPSLMFWYQ